MKKLIRFFNSIPFDKQLHFLYGEQIYYILFVAFMVVCVLFPQSQGNLRIWEIGAICVVPVAVIGGFKETQDLKMDIKDALVTALGGLWGFVKIIGTIYAVMALSGKLLF